MNNPTLTTLGFAGGMLHVLNHSLFKSLLFFSAGNVYQATHSLNIEHFGGLIKKMPHTARLFLVAALAICGLPPFNGFVSEFLIYSGLYQGLGNQHPSRDAFCDYVASLFGLVLIGGLALLCFTKAFGTVFLGAPRRAFAHFPVEATGANWSRCTLSWRVMMSIGLFPAFYLQMLSAPVAAFKAKIPGLQQAASLPQKYSGVEDKHRSVCHRAHCPGWSWCSLSGKRRVGRTAGNHGHYPGLRLCGRYLADAVHRRFFRPFVPETG